MIIVATSDLHGWLPHVTESFDLMLLAGDIEPVRNHSIAYQQDWYKKDFAPWIESLPFKDEHSKVFLIGGNHSHLLSVKKFDGNELLYGVKENTPSRVVNLKNSLETFKHPDGDITVWGTPNCKEFCNWWNMYPDDILATHYEQIPKDLDILLSHDCPYGCCDRCDGWIKMGRVPEHIGNKPLREAILQRNIKLGIFGHLHTGNHNGEMLGNTLCYNVSYLNEQYEPAYPFKYIIWKNGQVVQDGD